MVEGWDSLGVAGTAGVEGTVEMDYIQVVERVVEMVVAVVVAAAKVVVVKVGAGSAQLAGGLEVEAARLVGSFWQISVCRTSSPHA